MKIVYILLAVIVVAAAGYYFIMLDNDADDTGSMYDRDYGDDADDMDSTDDTDEDMDDDDATMDSDTTGTVEGNVDVSVGSDQVFDVTGQNYSFSMTEMRVKKGDTVTVNFTSAEGMHDWVIDEFDAATERVSAGQSTSVTFVADSAGTFEYYCAVGNHRQMGMVGKLIVE